MENKLFFGDQRPTIFFYVSSKIFLSYAFPIMYVWCFFWSTYFSSISTTNFFFLPTFSTNFFFLTLVATNYFFQFYSRPPPPPPDIKWCVPKNILPHAASGIVISHATWGMVISLIHNMMQNYCEVGLIHSLNLSLNI